MNKNLKVNLAGLSLKNPLLTASGTFGFGTEYSRFFDPEILGGITVKAVTLEPRYGNPDPRIAETPAGMLNAIGLENPGVDKFLSSILPTIKEMNTPIIVNAAGSSEDDYVEVVKKLQVTGVAAIELNISCPNVKEGGIAFGSDPDVAARLVKKVRQVCKCPLIVKLSPNVTDIVKMAKAIEYEGADALSLINTLIGMGIDIEKKEPLIANVIAGLSGPAIKPVALRMVWQVAQQVKVPIIGMGGITSGADVIEFLLAGANAVAIGTGWFHNPWTAEEILVDIDSYMERHKISDVNELVGALRIS
jgi:dihydroorotate dehydrogenase (subfamily 1) family protein